MKHFFLVLFASIAIAASANAQKSPTFQNEDGAIKGYDAVSYFTENKAIKGTKDFQVKWNEAAWYFSSQKNKELFQANPEKYAPQYGGYCAYGTAEGHKAPTDPMNAWTIIDGKLYFNYNTDVMSGWRKDTKGFIEKANNNWPKIKNEK
ncbi:MAG: YHS domain-containing protein [Bacteroidetes bacterium]|nr:YHS domain-containing protein [Bacteroidota bacterium]